jgi:hypothetical protein
MPSFSEAALPVPHPSMSGELDGARDAVAHAGFRPGGRRGAIGVRGVNRVDGPHVVVLVAAGGKHQPGNRGSGQQ